MFRLVCEEFSKRCLQLSTYYKFLENFSVKTKMFT